MAELNTVSYDQYKNIPSYEDLNKKCRVVFSSKCYENILQMSINAINNNREWGRFFVGRVISNEPRTIYFDYNTSEFEQANGPMGEGKAVKPSPQNYAELNNKIREYKTSGIIPVVLHFHSHPRTGIYESFSDQDLHSYAKMQAQNENCIAMGMLGFPIDEIHPTFGMCIVNPENSRLTNGIGTADFVRCEDICFIHGNDIYKVGNFEKKYNGRNYPNLSLGIVRQPLILQTSAKVNAEGIDPNNGNRIEPFCIGYTDTAGNLYFNDENLSLKTNIPHANTPKTFR